MKTTTLAARYAAPVLKPDPLELGGDPVLDWEVFSLLTDAQRARLARWSLDMNKTVFEVLLALNPVARQFGDTNTVELTGSLPTCPSMVCGLMPDGSVHT